MFSRFINFACTALVIWYPASSEAMETTLTRQDAVQIALETNPEVVAAQKAWEAAKAKVIQASALPDPKVELDFEELSGIAGLGDFGERSLGLTQTVEFPLKWRRRRTAAQQSAEAIRLSVLETTRQDIALRVKIGYDGVLFSERVLAYNRENLELIQSFANKARLRWQSGDVPPLEVMRAEVEAGMATNRFNQIQNDLSGARATLNTLMARETQAPFQLEDELVYHPFHQKLEELKTIALEQRPDILGSKWALASARSDRGRAQAALLPDLSVGLFRQTLEAPKGTEDFWRVGFGLEIPLWGAASQRGELAEAKAAAEQAEAEREHTRRQALLQIENAYSQLVNAEQQVELFQAQIMNAARRSFEVASRSYQEGKVTYLEVLESQRVLIEVREEYAGSLFDYRAALAQLEWAVGGNLPERANHNGDPK